MRLHFCFEPKKGLVNRHIHHECVDDFGNLLSLYNIIAGAESGNTTDLPPRSRLAAFQFYEDGADPRDVEWFYGEHDLGQDPYRS